MNSDQFKNACNTPAFPVPHTMIATADHDVINAHEYQHVPEGMTLLDYFAGQVIGPMVAEASHLEYGGFGEDAYKIAQQMIAAREELK